MRGWVEEVDEPDAGWKCNARAGSRKDQEDEEDLTQRRRATKPQRNAGD